MQDIVFYAIANETLGIVRDYANARNQTAPVLVLGVSVCLRIRLFAASDTATPYPVSAFSGIAAWQWNMDADFDRSTTCKLAADAGSITVQSVTDTVNGETLTFTEVAIPISNTNTQELAAWLGNEKKRSGLNGELVGYDNTGNAVFVLQIENFTVRNRVAGLGDPTALDQGIVTRSIAEEMIQTAVSSATEPKQDKLNSANAGTGISINSGGVISTSDVPQSAVTGLSASLAAKQDTLSAGYRMEIISGSTVDQSRFFNIETPSGSTVTLMAGHAYKILATTSAKTLIAESFSTSQFGLDGHAEIFVANTGYIHTGANVILANALEPDAVNNCTVRFHDGLAIISVEDHVAGYIVVSASGSTAGTLPYALHDVSSSYIAFDASLNGQTLDLGGVVTSAGEKHVVGNGYTDTILTGGVSCTSKTTFANLSMQDVSVLGGTATFGDVFIPSGATVSANGGDLVLEKVTGAGTINAPLGIDNATADVNVSGITFTGGGRTAYGAYFGNVSGDKVRAGAFVSCTFADIACSNGRAVYAGGASVSPLLYDHCIFSGNYRPGSEGAAITALQIPASRYATIKDCSFGLKQGVSMNGPLYVAGSNTALSYIGNSYSPGNVVVKSGAIIDLTGNTVTTPIAPASGVTFEPGGATVYPSAGSASAYMLDNVTLASLGNTTVIPMSGTQVRCVGKTVRISGGTFTGGVNSQGGALFFADSSGSVNSAVLVGVTVANNSGTQAGGGVYQLRETVHVSACTIASNSSPLGKDYFLTEGTVNVSDSMIGTMMIASGGVCKLSGSNSIDLIEARSALAGNYGSVTISSGASINLTSSINPGGGITVLAGGCTVNGAAISARIYTSIVSSGGSAVAE